MKRPTIAIVGAGRLGSALAQQLVAAGYEIGEIICRDNRGSLARARRLAASLGASASPFNRGRLSADVVWFCVPDAEITSAAAQLSSHSWKNKIALHSSGALASDQLQALRKKGAHLASVHPLMTFVGDSAPGLRGVTFAIEGEDQAVRVARRIARDLGGDVILLRKREKGAYHAFATIICPLLVSLLATSEAVAALAGMSKREARLRMMPIIRQTLANYAKSGPVASFSGPIVRGDTSTILRHLQALQKLPAAKKAYVGLAMAALEYLPSRNRKELQTLLQADLPCKPGDRPRRQAPS